MTDIAFPYATPPRPGCGNWKDTKWPVFLLIRRRGESIPVPKPWWRNVRRTRPPSHERVAADGARPHAARHWCLLTGEVTKGHASIRPRRPSPGAPRHSSPRFPGAHKSSGFQFIKWGEENTGRPLQIRFRFCVVVVWGQGGWHWTPVFERWSGRGKLYNFFLILSSYWYHCHAAKLGLQEINFRLLFNPDHSVRPLMEKKEIKRVVK
jgi:hypothetical protein